MGLTRKERVQAIIEFRFTERQARFLELVMRHGGVCVPRQYARFAGVANGGEKCNAFFDKLVFRGRAVRCECVHNRARLYHVHNRRMYQAIGEPDSRYRRPVPARRAVERLMLLDAVLTAPDLEWLTTASEKLAHHASLAAKQHGDKPSDQTAGRPVADVATTLANVSGGFPIGIDPAGRAVLLHLALQPWTDEFRLWLQAHAAFLCALPTWTVRLVFPRPLDRAYAEYQRVIHEELEAPLHPGTVGELKWYLERRQKAATSVDAQTKAFLVRAAEVFGAPRFTTVYRRWLKHGDSVFEPLVSTVLAEALTSGSGRVECLVLPHSYRHLAPVVNSVCSRTQPVEKGDEKGDESIPRPQPPPSTRPVETPTTGEEMARDWYRLIGSS
jgi:hypothetical protein